jgi:hypothetical protein
MIRKPTPEELKKTFEKFGGSTAVIPPALQRSLTTNIEPVLTTVRLDQVEFLGTSMKRTKRAIRP